MTGNFWLPLNLREKTLLLDALSSSRASSQAGPDEIDALVLKLARAKYFPQITVGVQGGQVQWALGNPFPIRVCDYDIDGDECPDVDERGQPCRISSFESPDSGIDLLS
jgi:hypothetical protein